MNFNIVVSRNFSEIDEYSPIFLPSEWSKGLQNQYHRVLEIPMVNFQTEPFLFPLFVKPFRNICLFFFSFFQQNISKKKKHLQFQNFLRTVYFLPGFPFQLFTLWNKNSINFYNNVLSKKSFLHKSKTKILNKNWYTKKLISKIAKNFKNLHLLRIVYLIVWPVFHTLSHKYICS